MLVNTIMIFFLIYTVHFQGTIQSKITSNSKSLRQAMLFLNPFNTRYTVCQIKSEEIHYIYISLSVAKYSTSKINISSDHKLTSSLCYLVPLGSLLFTFSCIYNASQRWNVVRYMGLELKRLHSAVQLHKWQPQKGIHKILPYLCMSKDLQDGTILSCSSLKHSKYCNTQANICVEYNSAEKKTKQNLLKERLKKINKLLT